MIAPYLASSLNNLFKPENTSQFKLLTDQNSIGIIDFSINTSIPVTIYSNTITFRDSNKSFKLDGVLLETMTYADFNVDSNPQDWKIDYEFGKEMEFNIKQKRGKSNREKILTKLLKSPAIMASGNSVIFSSSDPNEVWEVKNITTKKTSQKQFWHD